MSLRETERAQRLDAFLHDKGGSTERIHHSIGREREAGGSATYTKGRKGGEEKQSTLDQELEEFMRSVTDTAVVNNARKAWEEKI
jgi:hypothetical protein